MHPDHSAGLTDPKTGGGNIFPNAELVVHQNEPRHWHDDGAMSRASERAQKLYFACAREQMAPYHNVMRTYASSVEGVPPGLPRCRCMAVLCRAHSGYMISSGKDSLLIWGDIVLVPEIQVPRPEVTIRIRIPDPHAAAATRRRVFDGYGGDGSAVDRRDARAFPRLCACREARRQLRAGAGAVGSSRARSVGERLGREGRWKDVLIAPWLFV